MATITASMFMALDGAQDAAPEQPLRLLSAQPFATGVIYLVYAPDPNPPAGHYQQAKENLPR